MLVVGAGNMLRKRHSMPVDMNLIGVQDANIAQGRVDNAEAMGRSKFIPLAPAPPDPNQMGGGPPIFAEPGAVAQVQPKSTQSNPNLRNLFKDSSDDAVWDPFFQP